MAVCRAAAVQCNNTLFGLRRCGREMKGAREMGLVWQNFERRDNCRSMVAIAVVIVGVGVDVGVGVGVRLQVGK